MANIARFDPFNDFDDMFKGFMVRPMRFDLDVPGQQMSIKVDVTKADGAYNVKAELPGVKKEDIHVSIDGSQVTISGEVKKEKEEKKGEEVIRSERYYGKVSRSFTLAQDVDEGKAEAKYADGVLTLTLPTKAKSSARQLTVS
jgi:HSP20 family protein